MKNRFTKFFFLAILMHVLQSSCKVNYSMSGASVSPDVKTITVKLFNKTATLGPPTLTQTFTEKLKDKFITQTDLSVVQSNGDLTLEGSITSYTITPQAIQSNELAARNRLSISVNVKFTNLKNEKQNYEETFTRFSEYSSSQNISAVEENLIADIYNQLVDDIFNKSMINW